jgi:hypothetical protein
MYLTLWYEAAVEVSQAVNNFRLPHFHLNAGRIELHSRETDPKTRCIYRIRLLGQCTLEQ